MQRTGEELREPFAKLGAAYGLPPLTRAAGRVLHAIVNGYGRYCREMRFCVLSAPSEAGDLSDGEALFLEPAEAALMGRYRVALASATLAASASAGA